MKKSDTEKKNCTYIGGQAVMEGVMMRGKLAMATAVRDPEGNIQVEAERITPPEKRAVFPACPSFGAFLISFPLSSSETAF